MDEASGKFLLLCESDRLPFPYAYGLGAIGPLYCPDFPGNFIQGLFKGYFHKPLPCSLKWFPYAVRRVNHISSMAALDTEPAPVPHMLLISFDF